MNSRNKGAAGERELANILKGYETQRGQHRGRFLAKGNIFLVIENCIYCFTINEQLLFFTDIENAARIIGKKWCKLGDGYSATHIGKKQVPTHRFLIGAGECRREICGKFQEVAMNSKNKGKRGELELANVLAKYGYECRRSVQFCAANGDADVVGLPGVHIECKRVERLNIEQAMKQAIRDARGGEMPAVFHRKNRENWLVTIGIEDFMKLYGGEK